MDNKKLIEKLEKELELAYEQEPIEEANRKLIALEMLKNIINLKTVDGDEFIEYETLIKFLGINSEDEYLSKVADKMSFFYDTKMMDNPFDFKRNVESAVGNGETKNKLEKLYSTMEFTSEIYSIINKFAYATTSSCFDLFVTYIRQNKVTEECEICDVIDIILENKDVLKSLKLAQQISFINRNMMSNDKKEYLSKENIKKSANEIRIDDEIMGSWLVLRPSALRAEDRCAENQICTPYENQTFEIYTNKIIVKSLNGIYEYNQSELLGELDENNLPSDIIENLNRIKENIKKVG